MPKTKPEGTPITAEQWANAIPRKTKITDSCGTIYTVKKNLGQGTLAHRLRVQCPGEFPVIFSMMTGDDGIRLIFDEEWGEVVELNNESATIE